MHVVTARLAWSGLQRNARIRYFELQTDAGGTNGTPFLPGRKIVPELTRENRSPYYAALQAADRAWAEGHFDVSELAAYLQQLLKAQLADI